ncbi:MAG: hypothetical protein H0X24_11540 [Ktedonobacterales bacterium]|nr:hypothetical protein [Ktedonobacterales bacterium]
MAVHIFGIRHHGPGSARAVRDALTALEPDCLLVEGPPDAQEALPLLMNAGMQPPVALLIYQPDQPSRAVYYPFTVFSPEWQALTYGLGRGIPTRFFDLPQAIQFAREPAPAAPEVGEGGDAPTEPAPTMRAKARSGRRAAAVAEPPDVRDDPLALLAQAAGYSDHELWWEQQIEQRHDATDLFLGVMEAMTALRADAPQRRPDEDLREAHMRQMIRAAQAEGYTRVAVVCGAWHAPALGEEHEAKADAALLKGLPKVAVTATWIPWTNSRLAYRSGYGAGVTSPGWYEHLWHTPAQTTIRWLTKVAGVLRDEGLDTSSASVIEAVRLAEALAALRALPMPGLAEMHEATLTVLCHGEAGRMRVVRDRIEIGERMGAVPPETPAVPLQRDLDAQIKRLRMERTTAIKPLELDLREDAHRAKSQLLHRLQLLGIPWGKPERVSGGKQGTFWEHWTMQWQVEFAVNIIEANIWGNTVALAAVAYARHAADTAHDLPALTTLLDRVILAELPDAADYILDRVENEAAVAADVRHLMLALPPLAKVARYGDVRGTKAQHVLPVLGTLFDRALVGLPLACASLDDDAAQGLLDSLDAVQFSVDLLDDADQRAAWAGALRDLMERETIHGLVRGRCTRLLLNSRALEAAELELRARHALSLVVPPDQAAAWIAGVLRGDSERLLYEDGLWLALDHWLRDLAPETFIALLPLLRRAFADFATPARRKMGDKVKRLSDATPTTATTAGSDAHPIDRARADLTLPVLAQFLGIGKTEGK